MYNTIEKSSIYELTEKKSKFIACLMYIESKEEAESLIKEFKKKYHDARHNCSAYRVLDDGLIYEKSSDDGEPSGTAGAPMLNILQKNNLCNILVIVTRYFGGILLGTGGLVRCYSDATNGAIDRAEKLEVKLGIEFKLTIDYNNMESFKYYCKKNDINIIDADYSEKIILKVEIEDEKNKKFIEDIENRIIEVLNVEEIRKKYIKEIIK